MSRIFGAGTRVGTRVGTRAARRLALTAFVSIGLAAPLGAQSAAGVRWPIKTREHVDLWLHGFAMVGPDSAKIPLYRRGYRESLIVARNAASAITELDANADVLGKALSTQPNLLAAQFLALEFATWADLSGALDAFVKADGDPRRASGAAAQMVARLGSIFRTRDDRDFARRFLTGLISEREKFHHQWWVAETRRRDATLTAVDSIWQRHIRPALQSFLNHTQQGDGELVLSTVLEAEGRTITNDKRRNTVVVGWPESPERASDAVYCLLHELVGPLTVAAVEDNVTPAQKRSGVADAYQSISLVRGGAILAARLGADVGSGYMAFYLRATGAPTTGDVATDFARAFPLPEAMLSSIERQVAIAFTGI